MPNFRMYNVLEHTAAVIRDFAADITQEGSEPPAVLIGLAPDTIRDLFSISLGAGGSLEAGYAGSAIVHTIVDIHCRASTYELLVDMIQAVLQGVAGWPAATVMATDIAQPIALANGNAIETTITIEVIDRIS